MLKNKYEPNLLTRKFHQMAIYDATQNGGGFQSYDVLFKL